MSRKHQWQMIALLILFMGWMTACSESISPAGPGEQTDPGDQDNSQLASQINSVASSLVPNVTSSTPSSISKGLSASLSMGSDDDWTTYTSEMNVGYLTDIFGNVENGPVTQIRVLVSQFSGTLEGLFAMDPDFSCTGAEPLTGSDNLSIAFYGEISNGTSEDRYYDCLYQNEDGTLLYGKDSQDIVRVVSMSQDSSENTDDTETRGTSRQLLSVISTAYAVLSESDQTVSYLDLQYAQATLYNGVDENFGSDDDMVFKSRSRIIGRVVLDEEGNPVSGAGDFTVTKFDQSPNPEGDPLLMVTKSTGRGSYGAGDYFLFNIHSTVDAFAEIPGTFCVQQPSGGSSIPAYADPSHCTSLETSLAWSGYDFPFNLSPTIEEAFEDKPFFEVNDTDLIANDGSNFIIPSY